MEKITPKSIERQAANEFWESADYWRRQGDTVYADYLDKRAAEWAAMGERARDGL